MIDKAITTNRGKAWTKAEEESLANNFSTIGNVEEIATIHGRTPLAIAARLKRMDLITAEEFQEKYLVKNDSHRTSLAELAGIKGQPKGKPVVKPTASFTFPTNLNIDDLNTWTWSGNTAQEILSTLHTFITQCSKEPVTAEILQAKLGLNALNEPLILKDIAAAFDIKPSSVNKYFKKWLTVVTTKIKRSSESEHVLFILKCKRLFSSSNQPVMQAAYEFARAFYTPKQAIPISALLLHLIGFCSPYKRAIENVTLIANEYRINHERKLERALSNHNALQHWAAVINNAIYPENYSKFSQKITFMNTRVREINEHSDGITGSYFSKKCRRNVAYESGQELAILRILEKTQNVIWYQEQPIKIPYILYGRATTYTPDVALVTNEGNGIVIEVKPLLNMPLYVTLVKALAAIEYLHVKGIGYLIADRTGRSLKNLAAIDVDKNAEREILEMLDAQGELTYSQAKGFAVNRGVSFEQLCSIIIRNDLEFSSQPFLMRRMQGNDISFRRFIGHI